MTLFPGNAGRIEEVIGTELTTLLLRRWGGCQISIPVKARGSKLAEVIGEPAADALIREIGHGKMTLPCGSMRGHKRRVAEIREAAIAALRRGRSLQQVAMEFDLHTRTVSKYRAEIEAGANERQMQLPFDTG
jgi:DNA-binding CsgD family transcriptional regulator